MTTIKRVGAWATSSTLANPSETVQRLLDARCNLVSIMCNDKPSGRVFDTFDTERIVALAHACRSAGIEVHLTSWIRPYSAFIADAADVLLPLVKRCGASLLVWDAEEPWTQADAPRLGWAEAAALISTKFAGVPMGLTAIGSVSEAKIEALAQVCAVWIPQAYATTDSDAKPETVVPYCLAQWRKHLGPGAAQGEPRDGWIVGVAAYDQSTVPSRTMQPPIDDVREAGIECVCYWSLNAIAREPAVREFVAGVRPPAVASSAGVMPVLVLADLPRGVPNWALLRVQALLLSHGCDPGPLDGLPGPKTSSALAAFQATHGGTVGTVDGDTWLALLGA